MKPSTMLKRLLLVLLAVDLVFFPAAASANANIPGFYGSMGNLVQPSANQLPVIQSIVSGVSGLEQVGDNQMVVHQSDSTAILDWQSFDIGADAWVHFNQQGNTNWAALNRIFDQNPSQIFGRLTADGKVYLINPNGMLFGPGASVNVHTLAASALQMDDEYDFPNGLMRFAAPEEEITEDWLNETWVVNQGLIEVQDGGAVYLLAPNVANSGSITAPDGIINIAAATDAEYTEDYSATGTSATKTFTVNNMTGEVINAEDGRIQADGGDIRLFGRVVNTDGLIRSVQAVNDQGRIELRAVEKIHTGPTSQIETPIDSSQEIYHSSFTLSPGIINLTSGQQIVLEGEIYAPSGEVQMEVIDSEDSPGRIYMAGSSTIDVAGLWVDKNAEDLLVDVQLNSVELRDDQLQQDGILSGQTITFNQTQGSSFGYVTEHLEAIEITTAEQAITGGDVSLNVDFGDIIIRDGAHIDFSGGGVHYQAGTAETTMLICGNTVYDISSAPQYLTYDQVLNDTRSVYERFGVTEEFDGIYYGGATSLKDYSPEYRAGANAGSLTVVAPTIVLNGTLDGSVTVGPYQTEAGEVQGLDTEVINNQTIGQTRPRAGSLTVGRSPANSNDRDLYMTADPVTSEIVVSGNQQALPEAFGPETSLSEAYGLETDNVLLSDYYDEGSGYFRTILSADTINQAGLQDIWLYAAASLHIESDAHIILGHDATNAGSTSTFSANARRIIHEGVIQAPGGTISFETSNNYTLDVDHDGYLSAESIGSERIHLAAGSQIDVSGERINNSLSLTGREPIQSGYLDGGTVILYDYAAAGRGVVLEEGASINVSGGYQIDPDGTVTGGNAGIVDIQATAIVLDGSLAGHSLPDYDGGELRLQAKAVTVTAADLNQQLPVDFTADTPLPEQLLEQLTLGDSQLESSGFSIISLASNTDGFFMIEDGAVLTPSNTKLSIPLAASTDNAADEQVVNYYGGSEAGSLPDTADCLVTVPDIELGETAISIETGKEFGPNSEYYTFIKQHEETQPVNAGIDIYIPEYTTIAASPTGAVSLETNSEITVEGIIQADGGSIALTGNTIYLREGSRLLARGGNQIDDNSLVNGVATDVTVFDAGSIDIHGSSLIQVDSGAVLDVSAADSVIRYMAGSNGLVSSMELAGHAGEVKLSFSSSENANSGLIFNGELVAWHANLTGVGGGSLQLTGSSGDLRLSNELLAPYPMDDIDNLSLVSQGGAIVLMDAALDLELNGVLRLDANEIRADSSVPEDARFTLAGDHVLIQYSQHQNDADLIETPTGGSAFLSINGRQGIELFGQVAMNGFQHVSLSSSGDLYVSDNTYIIGGQSVEKGGLITDGDLILSANRIYPTTLSRFAFLAGGEEGTIAIHGNGETDSTPIYSADGQLIFAAREIIQNGVVKAPMGDIVFCGDFLEVQNSDRTTELDFIAADTVIFSQNSVTSSAGEATVYYGNELNEENLAWTSSIQGNTSATTTDVEDAPVGSILIAANAFIAAPGAEMDVSGGGDIFSYRNDPGIEGSVDPLAQNSRYVILPSSPDTILPESEGETTDDGVYFTANDLIGEGEYALVSAQYAWAEGAMVIEDIGPLNSPSGQASLSNEGYNLVIGYFSQIGTDRQDTTPHVFVVRSAQDVLAEGYFQTSQLTAGDGGTIRLTGSTNIVEANLNLAAMEGFQPGTLDATGVEILIGNESTDAAMTAIQTGTIPAEMQNRLVLNADGLLTNNQGVLRLGSLDDTRSVWVDSDTQLIASQITLSSREEIGISSGASLNAVETGGTIQLVTQNGILEIQENAVLHAAEQIVLDTQTIDLKGDLQIDEGHLTLAGNSIYIIPDELGSPVTDGLLLSQSQWDVFSGFASLELKSRSGIFLGPGVDLTLQGNGSADEPEGTLTLDTGLISIVDDAEGRVDRISAGRINLIGSADAMQEIEAEGGGQLIFEADEIIIGDGMIRMDGYERIDFNADTDLALQGSGSLESRADLHLSSARVTAIPIVQVSESDELSYQAPDFVFNTTGDVLVASVEAGATETDAQEVGIESANGGRLSIYGRTIEIDGQVDLPAGFLSLISEGVADDATAIHLTDNAILTTDGTDNADGGEITLSSASGNIDIASGALVSVSAGAQGDAGSLAILSPSGSVLLNGELAGRGATTASSQGGAFTLDARNIGELASLAGILESGGFNRQINIRSRAAGTATGLSLAAGATLSAQNVKLVADGGSMEILGTISTVDSENAGLIELYAENDIDIHGRIVADVQVADSQSSEIYIGVNNGDINFHNGALIDVSSTAGDAGGIVRFRAQRDETSSRFGLQGSISGAEQVIVEAFSITAFDSDVHLTSDDLAEQVDLAAAFVENLDWNFSTLDTNGVDVTVVPGIEFRSSGDLTVSDEWSLSSRFGDHATPGALTIRSAGNLYVVGNIEDRPVASFYNLEQSSTEDTWGIRLIAGSDLSSANPNAVTESQATDSGTLSIADGSLVYTQSASLWFASGGDTTIGQGKNISGYFGDGTMFASLMTYDKPIRGNVGGSLTINASAIQSALGNIGLNVGGDLELQSTNVNSGSYSGQLMGAIRTLGRWPDLTPGSVLTESDLIAQYWNYTGGGDIQLLVGGNIIGNASKGWGNRYLAFELDQYGNLVNSYDVWGPAYGVYGLTHGSGQGLITQGIAAMGGGSINAKAGGNVYASLGVFGEGDLYVAAGKDLDGRFLVSSGIGELIALQNFGQRPETVEQARHSQLELFDAAFSVTASGSLNIGAILNPGVISDEFSSGLWNMGYTTDSSVSLVAEVGDISYSGQYDYSNLNAQTMNLKSNILPAAFFAKAGRDIHFNDRLITSMILAPSSSGQLVLDAGRDINGGSYDLTGANLQSVRIVMSEADPDEIYGFQDAESAASIVRDVTIHLETPLYADSDQAVSITAGRDVKNIDLTLPKSVNINAGQNIYNFGLYAQTLSAEMPNSIIAGQDIILQSSFATGSITRGIESAGPAGLMVQAGNNIDLGATAGIQTTGSITNPYLPEGDSFLLIVAGISDALTPAQIAAAFEDLKTAGEDYSTAISEGDTEKAEEILAATRNDIIPLLTPGESATEGAATDERGILNMTKSQISTSGTESDLYIIATGDINVGQSALSAGDESQTGINAQSGGSINIYLQGDLNVNESRIVSFGGGDILAWSDLSDINAGRGSKAAVSASSPRLVVTRNEEGQIIDQEVVFDPPAVGSGIRALTYDPDGERGPLTAPEPGNIYLIAPQGTIDAGEAGIKGNNVFLAAQEVVNVQNIEISGTSVGVPEASAGAGSLAALSGAGSVSETSKLAEESAAMRSVDERFKSYVEELSENLVPKWIAVEVVGFGETDSESSDQEHEKNAEE